MGISSDTSAAAPALASDKPPRDVCRQLAKVSEQSERFEDMVRYMKYVVEEGTPLSVDERNLLSVAYKNIVGTRRASWRIINSHKEKPPSTDSKFLAHLDDVRGVVESELRTICNEILEMLSEKLLKNLAESDYESKVFYLKMQGDYHRYIAEFTAGTLRDSSRDAARTCYADATAIASAHLPPTNPIRLGLALNFSVFYYEIEGSQARAVECAKKAFDDAIAELDTLSEDSYKDSTLIMQLLRDNITLWVAEAEAAETTFEPKPAN